MSTLQKQAKPRLLEKQESVIPAHPFTPPVFVVDDDETYLTPLVNHLKKRTKYKVYSFTNGEDCLIRLNLKPKVVILDYNLHPQQPNQMNGLDVLRRIKNLSPRTYVVMLSGRDLYWDVVTSLKLGAYTYVIKDIEALDSLKKILRALFKDSGENETQTDIM